MVRPATEQVGELSLVPGAVGEAGSGATSSDPSAAAAGEVAPVADSGGGEPAETYVRDVDELAALLLRRAVQEVGVPVEVMRKKHKVQVIRQLQDKGFFLLREAVEQAAEALGVTRFTIYNYLNEIGARAQPHGAGHAQEES